MWSLRITVWYRWLHLQSCEPLPAGLQIIINELKKVGHDLIPSFKKSNSTGLSENFTDV